MHFVRWQTSDIAIQNGGGVRTDIAKGDFTMGDAYKLLPCLTLAKWT